MRRQRPFFGSRAANSSHHAYPAAGQTRRNAEAQRRSNRNKRRECLLEFSFQKVAPENPNQKRNPKTRAGCFTNRNHPWFPGAFLCALCGSARNPLLSLEAGPKLRQERYLCSTTIPTTNFEQPLSVLCPSCAALRRVDGFWRLSSRQFPHGNTGLESPVNPQTGMSALQHVASTAPLATSVVRLNLPAASLWSFVIDRLILSLATGE